jgi:hypothetical protein
VKFDCVDGDSIFSYILKAVQVYYEGKSESKFPCFFMCMEVIVDKKSKAISLDINPLFFHVVLQTCSGTCHHMIRFSKPWW